MAIKGDEVILKPVLPNAGIQTLYRKKLDRLIYDMHKSILYWLSAEYKKQLPQFANDADPSNELQKVLNTLSVQWFANFDAGAQKIADWFCQSNKNYVDGTLAAILKDVGIAVDFKMSKTMRTAYNASRNEQINLIKSIAQQHLSYVEGAVMRSVSTGRDLETLVNEIGSLVDLERIRMGRKLGESNRSYLARTQRRAALIARDQNNKANSIMNRARQNELGITQAIWRHSHAGKEPRPEHVAANGKKYDLDKGMFLEGKWTFPSMEINCRCVSQPIIKGFRM
jgi:uncharacterized protein with gpF-like domain